MYRVPRLGEVWERWDGEIIQINGVCHDGNGNLCVEYDTHDMPGQLVELGTFLGVQRGEGFPHPRRYILVDGDDVSPDGIGIPLEAWPRDVSADDEKLQILTKVLGNPLAEETFNLSRKDIGDVGDNE